MPNGWVFKWDLSTELTTSGFQMEPDRFTTCFKTCATGGGIFYRGKSEVSLGLKLRQQTKIICARLMGLLHHVSTFNINNFNSQTF